MINHLNLISTYPGDIDDSIVSDVHQFHAYVSASNPTEEKLSRKHSQQDLYDLLSRTELKALFLTLKWCCT